MPSSSTKTNHVLEHLRVPRYGVVLHNDDFTPMEFVVALLTHVFGFNQEKAFSLMQEGHQHGSVVVLVTSRDVAESKADQCCSLARAADHPLMCTAEKLPDED